MGCVLLLHHSVAFAETDNHKADNQLTVEDLASHIEALTVGRAKFTQYNSDGSVSTGTLHISRPWHGRIDYDPPDNAMMIAEGRQVAVFDLNSNTGPSYYPLSRTPFLLLLAKDVNLSDKSYFVSFSTGPDRTQVTLRPSPGGSETITLHFITRPLEIAGWVYSDVNDIETSVVLDAIRRDVEFSQHFFSINWNKDRLYPEK